MKRSRLILATLLCLLLAAPARPSASEAWTSVRTRNLFLISNAGALELRRVAAWLELFHEAFSRLLSKPVFNSAVPTVGVVFRSDREFEPFKPLYQGRPADVAGFFQPGDDVNYIAISLEANSRDPLGAAFHEYVHLYVRDNVPGAPLWLNEGLAEFYGAFELANGEAIIGAPIPSYLRLLRNSKPLPLATLFSVNHDSAHYNERDQRGVFYAQSWALVHYLMVGEGGRRQPQLARYLDLLSAGVSLENSFQMAFQTSFEAMEGELNEYVRRDNFSSLRARVGRGDEYGSVQTEPLTEAEADYYLGDLLLHTGRQADAEKYFARSLALDSNLSTAHAALGVLRARQGRFAEARRHLQRGAAKSQNHLVHFFYAYALSREGMSDEGRVAGYTAENLQTMRAHLQTAIKLAPNFADAYHLLAFVNLVANEQLEQSAELIKRAIRLEPERQELKLVLAQIYLRQRDTESARRILESLARQGSDGQLRARAESLLANSSGEGEGVPQFTTAAPAKIISVTQPGGVASASGMVIDTSGPMPAVEQVIARYAKALGGQDKIQKLTSRVMRGRARVLGEFSGAAFEIYEKSPGKAMTVVKLDGKEIMWEGFDGGVGWRRAAAGTARRLKGAELAELRRDHDFYAPLRLPANYARLTLLGKVKIGYREAYLVEGRPVAGEPDRLYFEMESGLLIRCDSVRTSWRGRAAFETYFDDWREVEGVRVPFGVTRSSPHFTIAFMVEEVKFNVAVNDLMFAQPVAK